jgi:hypothetical protein
MATAGCAAAAAVICDGAPVARAFTAATGALLSLQGLALGMSARTAAVRWLLPQALLLLMFAAAAAAAVFSLTRCAISTSNEFLSMCWFSVPGMLAILCSSASAYAGSGSKNIHASVFAYSQSAHQLAAS